MDNKILIWVVMGKSDKLNIIGPLGVAFTPEGVEKIRKRYKNKIDSIRTYQMEAEE